MSIHALLMWRNHKKMLFLVNWNWYLNWRMLSPSSYHTMVNQTLFVFAVVQGFGSVDESAMLKQRLQKANTKITLVLLPPTEKVTGCLSSFIAKEKVSGGLSQEVT